MKRKLSLLALVIAAGCGAPGQPAAGSDDAASQQATTEAQWAAMEAQADGLVAGDQVVAPTRLQQSGAFLEHDVPLKANTCYELALLWAQARTTYVSVMFVADEAGQRPNDHLAGRREKLAKSGGLVRYCADRDGAAKINISALDQNGAVMNNARLEYVLVVGGQAETAEETAARRDDEAKRGQKSQATMDENVRQAEEKERRAKERAKRQCKACQTAYLACIGNGEGEGACGRVFQECNSSLDSYMASQLAGPCAKP